MANDQPTWRRVDEGKACLLDKYRVEVGVWIVCHTIIRAGEGGVLLELSLVNVCREKKKNKGTYSARMPILVPIPIPVNFPCIVVVFCTTTAHVAAAVICPVGCIHVSHYSGRRGGGDFGGEGRRCN